MNFSGPTSQRRKIQRSPPNNDVMSMIDFFRPGGSILGEQVNTQKTTYNLLFGESALNEHQNPNCSDRL